MGICGKPVKKGSDKRADNYFKNVNKSFAQIVSNYLAEIKRK